MNYEKMWNDLLKKLRFECEKVNGINGSTKEDHIKFNALYSIVKIMEDAEGEYKQLIHFYSASDYFRSLKLHKKPEHSKGIFNRTTNNGNRTQRITTYPLPST